MANGYTASAASIKSGSAVMRDYKKLITYYVFICLLLAIYAANDIRSSYLREKENTRARIANSSLLISEWIKGAFNASDYVLRDIVSQVSLSDLRSPPTDKTRQLRVSALLKSKVQMLPSYVTGADLTDSRCIVTHAYNTPPRPSITGFDGSQREWCTVPQANLQMDASITHLFFSNTGKLEVGQNRIIRGDKRRFEGVAGLEIELDFFSDWIEQIPIDAHGTIAIIDTQNNLLARKPALPEKLGKIVENPRLKSFINSGQHYTTFSQLSPMDGESRLYGVRKVGDLPFIVIVGEADQDWQRVWYSRTLLTLGMMLLIFGLLSYIYRLHQKLLQANQVAEQALADQRQFIAMVSHEFRSPLSVIDVSAHLLTRQLGEASESAPVIARIRRGVERLVAFVDNCLTQERFANEAFVLQLERVNLNELAVWASAQQTWSDRIVVTEIDPALTEIEGDPQLLRILLSNLLSNAAKYSSAESVITLRVMPHEKNCRIEVIDQGQGIPVDELPLIFNKYMRGRAASGIPGAGLGLSLAARIVKLHGGTIEALSRPGEGSRFVVEIPINPANRSRDAINRK